jgi:hypothetical protein
VNKWLFLLCSSHCLLLGWFFRLFVLF